MTSKLTITRERLEELAAGQSGFNLRIATHEESQELARMALAAMDGEPVAYMVRRHDEHEGTGTLIHAEYLQRYQDRGDYHYTPLYRHAQPVPVVQCPFPCGWDNLNKLAIQDAAFVAIALVEGEPATESIRQAVIANNDRLLKAISACRAAMLSGGKS